MTSTAISNFVATEGPGGEQVIIDAASRLSAVLFEKWGGDTPSSRLPEVIIDAMKIVERIGKLTGNQKKRAVIGVIVELVDSWNIGGSMEPVLLSMIPAMIDTFVVADKGKLHIKAPSWTPMCCFRS